MLTSPKGEGSLHSTMEQLHISLSREDRSSADKIDAIKLFCFMEAINKKDALLSDLCSQDGFVSDSLSEKMLIDVSQVKDSLIPQKQWDDLLDSAFKALSACPQFEFETCMAND